MPRNKWHIYHGDCGEEASCFRAPDPGPIETTRSLAIDFAHAKIWIVNVGNYSTAEQ